MDNEQVGRAPIETPPFTVLGSLPQVSVSSPRSPSVYGVGTACDDPSDSTVGGSVRSPESLEDVFILIPGFWNRSFRPGSLRGVAPTFGSGSVLPCPETPQVAVSTRNSTHPVSTSDDSGAPPDPDPPSRPVLVREHPKRLSGGSRRPSSRTTTFPTRSPIPPPLPRLLVYLNTRIKFSVLDPKS